jgi:hypothetical protein
VPASHPRSRPGLIFRQETERRSPWPRKEASLGRPIAEQELGVVARHRLEHRNAVGPRAAGATQIR